MIRRLSSTASLVSSWSGAVDSCYPLKVDILCSITIADTYASVLVPASPPVRLERRRADPPTYDCRVVVCWSFLGRAAAGVRD